MRDGAKVGRHRAAGRHSGRAAVYGHRRRATADCASGGGDECGFPAGADLWLASEDHDFAEVNHANFPKLQGFSRLSYDSAPADPVPVGEIILDDSISGIVDQARELLGYSEETEWLAEAYRPGRTLAQAFAEFYGRIFAAHGLLVLDAAGREAHRLGAPVLEAAIGRADELHSALVDRNRALEAAGYRAQVAVAEQGSLLFLIEKRRAD